MKKHLFIILMALFPLVTFAEVALELHFKDTSVQQGRIVSVALALDSSEKFNFKTLEGQTLDKILYFHEISPSMNEAQIIFVKIPGSNSIVTELGNDSIRVNWNPINIVPTEAAQGFMFGDFSFPAETRWMLWFGVTVLAVLLLISLILINKKIRTQNKLKRDKLKVMQELNNCQNYQEVVNLWSHKHRYILTFPHLKEPFSRLESVLFKYQFKQAQSESEMKDVMKAYAKFKDDIQGGFYGI